MPKKAPPEVAAYLKKLPEGQRTTMVRLRNAVLEARPSLTQSLSPWGYVTFSTSEEKYVFTLIPHKQHVNLQIWNGAKIATKLPDLEGTGKGLRHIKFSYDKPVDATLVGKAIRLSLAS
jgi:hypothetical protein